MMPRLAHGCCSSSLALQVVTSVCGFQLSPNLSGRLHICSYHIDEAVWPDCFLIRLLPCTSSTQKWHWIDLQNTAGRAIQF